MRTNSVKDLWEHSRTLEWYLLDAAEHWCDQCGHTATADGGTAQKGHPEGAILKREFSFDVWSQNQLPAVFAGFQLEGFLMQMASLIALKKAVARQFSEICIFYPGLDEQLALFWPTELRKQGKEELDN